MKNGRKTLPKQDKKVRVLLFMIPEKLKELKRLGGGDKNKGFDALYDKGKR